MIILFVRVESTLSEEEALKIACDREPQFCALPGLLQKYYVKLGQPNQYGGIYVWDSMESLKAYRESELAASIAKAYKAVGPPSIEIFETFALLRE